ncbi:MAG: PAS domain S-box protein, partial [Desulfobacteraceae bacterium]|nr:PAS domain S-box protein [Desulfobacteraceae bacterium]
MRIQPLRKLLTLQSMVIAMVPFALAATLCMLWLYQRIRTDIESYQRHLVSSIAAQVESYLTSAMVTVRMTAAISMDADLSWHNLQHVLDAQMAEEGSLKTIYAVSLQGRLMGVGLPPKHGVMQQELIGIDLSLNPLYQSALQEKHAIWSDTFLSVIGGGISVALAISSPNMVAIGEIELRHLSDYLQHISLEQGQHIFVLDRRGQIIVDQDGRYTAQQFNIGNLPLIKSALESHASQSGELQFDQRTMIANLVHTPTIDWYVLVAQPKAGAYASLKAIVHIVIVGALIALLAGILFSIFFSRRMSQRFETLTVHARRVAGGIESSAWPKSTITEFNELSANLEQMAAAIHAYERQTARLMSNLPGMVYRLTPDIPRKVLLASQGCKALTGYPAENLITNGGRDFQSLIHPDDQAQVWEQLQLHIAARRPYRLSYRIVTVEGQSRWVADHGQGVFDEGGVWIALEGFLTDSTESKEAEEKIRRSEKNFRDLFEESIDTIFISTVEGNYLDINPAGIQLLGYANKEEILALNIPRDVFIDPQDRAWLIHRLQQSGFVKDYEVRVKKKDGTIRTVLITATAILNEHNEVTTIRGIFRDATERKALEEQLRQAQKMEAIGALAGGVAHDFNNLLTPILGYAEIIQSDLPANSPLRESISQIVDASTKAKELVKQILTFSRQHEHELRPIQVHHIVQEAGNLLRASIPKSIEIKKSIHKTGYILADPAQIHQVVMNLGTNAYHAMRETGGTLSIGVKEIEVEPDLYLPGLTVQPGKYVRLEISDTGIGMDEAVKAKIFDPYFTTKKEGEGTGLGLAVVHGIVKNHQGYINVYSEPGQGATFHVYFPVLVRQAESEAVEQVKEIPRGTEHILVVDDEKPIIDLQVRMLEALGYQVTALTSGADALQLFARRPEDFDIVITDMTMPNMSGAVLSRNLMQIRKDIPIILCTGFSDLINEEKARAMGIRRYVM